VKLTLEYVLSHGRGVERAFCCPVHDDKNPSASVNVVKGVWCCYSCGAHGDTSGVIYDLDIDQVMEELDLDEEEREPYPESWLGLFTSGEVHSYWLSRFTPEACRHFQLGYDTTHDACTYPLRTPAGALLGVVHRRLHGERPKYRYPMHVKISELLFNYSYAQRRIVVLVEGAMDAVAAWEAGVDAFAVYGDNLSRSQLQLIHRVAPRQVILAYDSDKAGREATERSRELLVAAGLGVTVARINHDLGKDLGDLTIDERREVFAPLL